MFTKFRQQAKQPTSVKLGLIWTILTMSLLGSHVTLKKYFKSTSTRTLALNPSSANLTKWSSALKQFVGNLLWLWLFHLLVHSFYTFMIIFLYLSGNGSSSFERSNIIWFSYIKSIALFVMNDEWYTMTIFYREKLFSKLITTSCYQVICTGWR